jgi:hypothetical protein
VFLAVFRKFSISKYDLNTLEIAYNFVETEAEIVASDFAGNRIIHR